VDHSGVSSAGTWVEERVLLIIVTLEANSASDFFFLLAIRTLVAAASIHLGGSLELVLMNRELIALHILAIILADDEFPLAKSYNIINLKFVLLFNSFTPVVLEGSQRFI